MKLPRTSGILLHPTSLPGPYGIGELGAAATQFVDFLAEAGQSLWQILPLGPTGYGDSPYASFSSFAGNPLLIALDTLVEQNFLSPADLAGAPVFSPDAVDFGALIRWKIPILHRAARRFLADAGPLQAGFDRFCATEAHWLDDFALFMAVKAVFDEKAQAEGVFGAMWSNYWDADIALRQPQAIARWQKSQAEEIAIQKALQFFFFQQWNRLHAYANRRGIKIIGDIPIFVAPDSADVWANPDLFYLDEKGRPTVVAGVPPDYFSPTGQLWGNPLYNWPKMKKQGYQWWTARLKATLHMVDMVRIDHFRGFVSYWEIPAGEKTAIKGRWVDGPGADFFHGIEKTLGNDLPIIAEDLGVITQEVTALREQFGFPGMKILQFAFDLGESGAAGATNAFLPHNFIPQAVVYPGTHDNDTVRGWYDARSEAEKDLVRRYLGRPDHDIAWEFIRLAMASVAGFAIFAFQDVLSLGRDARMNTPNTLGGNWQWRFRAEAMNPGVAARLRELVDLYARNPALWEQNRPALTEADLRQPPSTATE